MQTIKIIALTLIMSFNLLNISLGDFVLDLNTVNRIDKAIQKKDSSGSVKKIKNLVDRQERGYSESLGKVVNDELVFEANSLMYKNILKTVENNQQALTKVYNDYPNIVKAHLNKESCNYLNFKDETQNTKLLNLLNKAGIKIRLKPKQIAKYIGCYIKDKGIKNTIETSYEEYRKINIGSGMKRFNGYVMRPGETISTFKETFLDNQENLVTGYALSKGANGGIIEIPVLGGGICGISTILYQNTLKTPGLEPIERRPHSRWYYSYYGGILGLDATMFGSFTAPRIDYKFKNASQNNIIFKTDDVSSPEDGDYTYSIESYQFPVKTENRITGIKNGNCGIVTIESDYKDNRTITSCYKEIK